MARYSLIMNDMWIDREFRNLEPKGKLLYIYLLTNPYCNQSGLYRLPIDIVELEVRASDLLLQDNHLWKYDKDNEVVYIPNYLKYNTAKTLLQIKGVASSIKSLPCTPLIVDFIANYVKNVSQDLTVFHESIIKMLEYQLEFRNDNKSILIKSILNK